MKMPNPILKRRRLWLLIIISIIIVVGVAPAALRYELKRLAPEKSSLRTSDDLPAPTDERELASRIEQVIAESKLSSARWGISVVDVKDGRILYERDGNEAYTPASNMKIFTTAVALDLLGADYRWKTSVLADSKPDANGRIAGDIVLFGRGAPDLTARVRRSGNGSSLTQLADDVYKSGVRSVDGSVFGDASYFRGEPLGDGWMWNDVQWYFGAEASALSIDDNAISVTITPGNSAGSTPEIKISPDTKLINITNLTRTVARGLPTSIGIDRGLSDNNLKVWGEFPAGGRAINSRIAIHDPALWAATQFRDALIDRGVSVAGDARSRDSRDLPNADSKSPMTELASAGGATLGEITRITNKESLNLQAELILRTLGKEQGATVPEPDPRRVALRGDDEAGLAVIIKWLENAGIATTNIAIHDGSGLSHLDRVTPNATAKLLAYMIARPAAEIFRTSLPIGGKDGTLQNRFKNSNANAKILAKTGNITYTSALSGYAVGADGEILSFSIMCNDDTTSASSNVVIDKIASLIVGFLETRK